MGIRTKPISDSGVILFISFPFFASFLPFPLAPLLYIKSTRERSESIVSKNTPPTNPLIKMMLGMEEVESSECSSGCQSGWTMYLEQSYEPPTSLHLKKGGSFEEEGEEEEDLSMVSDASSGPPHLHEEEQFFCYCNGCGNANADGCLCSFYAPSASASLAKSGGKKRRVESEKEKELSSLLDDTASSPLFNYSKERQSFHTSANTIKPTMENAVEFSCGFSATHFKKHLGYMQSSAPAKPTPARPRGR
ncbi:protein SOB FIVE-LIKE 5-like [Typha latifolia]|uniref:protein SOB FIVE-LIKE 5-like n=1 Tax=Typha latifolia TaxID=4733 RepID=UPI003C2EEDC8